MQFHKYFLKQQRRYSSEDIPQAIFVYKFHLVVFYISVFYVSFRFPKKKPEKHMMFE